MIITLLRGCRYNLKRITMRRLVGWLVGGISKEAYIFTIETKKFFFSINFRFILSVQAFVLHCMELTSNRCKCKREREWKTFHLK